MSVSESGRGWWPALLALLIFLVAGIYWPFGDDKTPSTRKQVAAPREADPLLDSIRVASWVWKPDRTGRINAVYGQVQNLSNRTIKQVVLQFRTQDENEQTIARHPIIVNNLQAGGKKPFREDVPRTGREAMGFVDVQKVNP